MEVLIYYNGEFCLGGTERYICYLAKALEGQGNVTIAYTGKLEKKDYEIFYGIDLTKIRFIRLRRYAFSHAFSIYGTLIRDYLRLKDADLISKMSADFDIFMFNSGPYNQTQVKPQAKKNIIVCHFLYKLRKNKYKTIINPNALFGFFYLKPYEYMSKYVSLTSFFINKYDKIIANSNYTRSYVKKFWKRDARIVYPPVDISCKTKNKENIIISLGRMTKEKNQLEMIGAFKSMKKDGLNDWKYYLFCPKSDDAYSKTVKKAAKKIGSVRIFENAMNDTIQTYLSKSKIFWNLSGWGVNQNINPERLEHFGMVNVEAMANGCIPIIFNGGGHKEIIENGKSGYLVNNKEQLIEKTYRLVKDPNLQRIMSKQACRRANYFSFGNFKSRLYTILK